MIDTISPLSMSTGWAVRTSVSVTDNVSITEENGMALNNRVNVEVTGDSVCLVSSDGAFEVCILRTKMVTFNT